MAKRLLTRARDVLRGLGPAARLRFGLAGGAVLVGFAAFAACGGCGKRLLIRTPQGAVASGEFQEQPFQATFGGVPFRTAQNVLVTVA